MTGVVESAALAHLHQALSLFQQVSSPVDEALIRRNLALVQQRRGHLADALEQAKLSLELSEIAGHQAGIARTRVLVGSLRALLGQHDQALLDCQRALKPLEDLDDVRGQGDAMHLIGNIYSKLSRHTQAITHYQRALDFYKRLDDRGATVHVLVSLYEAYQAAGATHAARRTLQDALLAIDELVGPDADSLRARLQGLRR